MDHEGSTPHGVIAGPLRFIPGASSSEGYLDITRTLGLDDLTYPGDPPFSQRLATSIAGGGPVNLSELTLGSHSGTHLDAPYHLLDDGAPLERVPLSRLFLEVHVVEVQDPEAVRAVHVHDAGVKRGQGVLFRTRNSGLPRDSFSNDFVYLTIDAALAAVDRGAALVGLDYPSVERPGDVTLRVHRTLLEAGILILEDVDLRDVAPGLYGLVCLPLKWHGADGAPCRAVLLSAAGGPESE